MLTPTPIVLYEDEALLVLAKPPGLVVNRSQTIAETTMQDWVEAYLRGNAAWEAELKRDEVFAERSGMVHRLDKDTSGVILFAKTVDAMQELQRQFKSRETQKTYLALVHGHMQTPNGLIRASVARHPKDRVRFTTALEGRESETYYEVQQAFDQVDVTRLVQAEKQKPDEERIKDLEKRLQLYAGFSLLAVQPKTGRTHQIRVHMQFVHHPIVGDAVYAGRKRAKLDALWCSRQFLHAWKIQFTHPQSGEVVEFEAPLPEDLQSTLSFLSN